MRSYLRITDDEDIADDAEITLALEAASRSIDRASNRQFGLHGSAVARVYTAEWNRPLDRYTVDVDDFMTVTGLVVKSSSVTEGTFDTTHTDYRTYPFNAAGDVRPWTRILFGSSTYVSSTIGGIQVTANWGWTAIPDTITQATLIQASRFLKRRESPFGIAGSPDLGNELRLLARLDPDVEQMVRAFYRWWGARG
jgi:hypothetical protein